MNQNITSNLAICPKIKRYPFRLKVGTRGILEVLNWNPDLDFWNFDPKIHFSANLGPKIQSSPFCFKIGTRSISRMLIPNPDLDFWNSDSKIHFWTNLGPKIQSCLFCLKIVFFVSNSFLGKFGPKQSKLLVLSKSLNTWYLRMLILIPTFVFLISN